MSSVIIWINGLFGVGKSATAELLAESVPGSWLVNPEEIGFGLPEWSAGPGSDTDFQDLPLWRALTSETIAVAEEAAGAP